MVSVRAQAAAGVLAARTSTSANPLPEYDPLFTVRPD